jgi:hypothetical protein
MIVFPLYKFHPPGRGKGGQPERAEGFIPSAGLAEPFAVLSRGDKPLGSLLPFGSLLWWRLQLNPDVLDGGRQVLVTLMMQFLGVGSIPVQNKRIGDAGAWEREWAFFASGSAFSGTK